MIVLSPASLRVFATCRSHASRARGSIARRLVRPAEPTERQGQAFARCAETASQGDSRRVQCVCCDELGIGIAM
jgi:hypothetical protein